MSLCRNLLEAHWDALHAFRDFRRPIPMRAYPGLVVSLSPPQPVPEIGHAPVLGAVRCVCEPWLGPGPAAQRRALRPWPAAQRRALRPWPAAQRVLCGLGLQRSGVLCVRGLQRSRGVQQVRVFYDKPLLRAKRRPTSTARSTAKAARRGYRPATAPIKHLSSF